MNRSEIDEIIKVLQNEKLSELNDKINEHIYRLKTNVERLSSSQYFEQHDELKANEKKLKQDFIEFIEANKSQLKPSFYIQLLSSLK